MSIIKKIQSTFSSDLYIQVWERRLKISRIDTSDVYDEEPLAAIKNNKKGQPVVVEVGNKVSALAVSERDLVVNPFSHPRLLVHDFIVAEQVLRYAIGQLHPSKWLAPAPRVIFQPMEKLEGGVTAIEMRVYRELCLGAGARGVELHFGDVLSMHNLDFDRIRRDHDRGSISR